MATHTYNLHTKIKDWKKKAYTVTVNGKENFKSDEEVYLDAEIVLLVNTYNGYSYEGM